MSFAESGSDVRRLQEKKQMSGSLFTRKTLFSLDTTCGYERGSHCLFVVYLHEVSGNHFEDSIQDKSFPGAIDEGFRDEIGLCIRDGKGFQTLHMLYELISVCITLFIQS
jgi:hypothetical protein